MVISRIQLIKSGLVPFRFKIAQYLWYRFIKYENFHIIWTIYYSIRIHNWISDGENNLIIAARNLVTKEKVFPISWVNILHNQWCVLLLFLLESCFAFHFVQHFSIIKVTVRRDMTHIYCVHLNTKHQYEKSTRKIIYSKCNFNCISVNHTIFKSLIFMMINLYCIK